MNILKDRWPQFKQELPTFLYLSILQIWINFNFPPLVRLPSPWNIVVPILLSVFCVVSYLFILAFPDAVSFIIDDILSLANQTPNPVLFKRLYIAFLALIYHAMYFFMWYKNYYGMSNSWYIILYVFYATIFVLLYRAIARYRNRAS